jgi:hypothetical protein
MTDNTGYRITSPDGWVVEASDEAQHRRVLVALACLSDVLTRLQALPAGDGQDMPRGKPFAAHPDGAFDKPAGREPTPRLTPAHQLPPVDTATLQKMWALFFTPVRDREDGDESPDGETAAFIARPVHH